MIPIQDFVNVLLLTVGVALIFIVLSDRPKDLLTLRIILFGYFLVAMQYNAERIAQDKFLLIAAAISFVVWLQQPVALTEESHLD